MIGHLCLKKRNGHKRKTQSKNLMYLFLQQEIKEVGWSYYLPPNLAAAKRSCIKNKNDHIHKNEVQDIR